VRSSHDRVAAGGVLLAALLGSGALQAQIVLHDETDRSALGAWFVLLADTQFYRPTSDVTDCAALVRHAIREALRPHSTDWLAIRAHTGPSPAVRSDAAPSRSNHSGSDGGEVRKVRLADLQRHPSPHWRPAPANSAFVGVYRLSFL
jgi:uncharacterized protein YfaT (DUF1175 family)